MSYKVSCHMPPSGRAWWLPFFASARAKTVPGRQKVSAGIVHSQSNDRAWPAGRPCKAGKKKLKDVRNRKKSCEKQ